AWNPPVTQPPDHGSPSRNPRALEWGAMILVVVAVTVVYYPVLGYPFTSMDDPRFILLNPQIVEPGNASLAELLLQPSIGYIVPVTGLIEAALWAISGGEAWSFHAAGFVGHLIVALLTLRVARRLLRLALLERGLD